MQKEEKELIMSVLSDTNLVKIEFIQVNVFGCYTQLIAEKEPMLLLLENQLEFYVDYNVDVNFQLKTKLDENLISLIIELKPNHFLHPDEIEIDDYNQILNHIQLYNIKYRNIIQSDGGKKLMAFVNSFQNLVFEQNKNDKKLNFLEFLENNYIDF